MTQGEFARIYIDSLSKRYPAIRFTLNPNLSISSAGKDSTTFQHFTDNAYNAYQSTPDSVGNIIQMYIAAVGEMYTNHDKIDVDHLIPVIKGVEYLKDVGSLNKGPKDIELVTEKYNDQLIIAYAEDSKNSISYLNEEEFRKLGISRDSLKAIAFKNFDKMLPAIQRQGNDGMYIVTAGGNYEASLILLPSIWSKEGFPVDGDFIVGISNRDILMVTGSNNKAGIDKIRKFIKESYNTGNYQVSAYLYKWTGKKFEKYD